MSRRGFLFFSFLFVFYVLPAQDRESGQHPYVIRGEVYADMEPIYIGHVDSEYPLDIPAVGRRALEEAAFLFSGMIYGWSFHYEVGERARGIAEILELEPVATIPFGDPRLQVTDTQIEDMRLRIWADYHLSDAQQRNMRVWRTGTVRNAQASGYGPEVIDEYPGWLQLKKAALEDAAKSALRTMLRGSERNRPKEASGFISLSAFPRFFIDSGRWAASARFRVQIEEIIPFSAY
jgi:hypothetical protein